MITTARKKILVVVALNVLAAFLLRTPGPFGTDCLTHV